MAAERPFSGRTADMVVYATFSPRRAFPAAFAVGNNAAITVSFCHNVAASDEIFIFLRLTVMSFERLCGSLSCLARALMWSY